MNDLIALKKHIDVINNQVTQVNSSLQSYSDAVKKDPVLMQKKLAELKKQIKQVQPKQVEKEEKPKEEKEKSIQEPKKAEENYNVTDLWGDPRYNPYFLNVAEYFGLKEKEYSQASPKINSIINWAANTTKSKKMGDIIAKIGSTLRGLQSPAYSERRYAILYRYIKLANELGEVKDSTLKKDIKKEMGGYKK